MRDFQYDCDKYEDTSAKYDDPAKWIASAIAAYTTMMTKEIPEGFGKVTWSDKRDALKSALIDVQGWTANGSVSERQYRPKEFVYTLRSWFVEGILDFLYSDRRIWTSEKWSIEEVRENTPKALSMLIEDIKN